MSSEINTQELFQLIQRAKHEWETTADSLSELICMIDENLVIQRANRTINEWDLAPITAVSGKYFHEVLHPDCGDDACYLRQFLNTAWHELQTNGFAECEANDERLQRYLNIRMRPVFDKQTNLFESAAVVVEDITGRKALEQEREQLLEQVEEQSQLLRTILSNTPDQIYMYDSDGICLYANLAAEWHLGLSQTEIIGKTWVELGFPVDEERAFEQIRKDVLQQRKRLSGEMQHRRGIEDGRYDYIVSPVLTSPKVASNVIVTLRDVTERHMAQQALQASFDTLEERVEARTVELSEINSVLQDEIHERERAQEAEQQQRNMTEILHGITLSLTQTLHVETMLDSLLTYMKRVIPYENAHVLLQSDDAKQVNLAYSTLKVAPKSHDFADDTRIKHIMKTGESVVLTDCTDCPQIVTGYKGKSWLAIPIIGGESIIGVCIMEHSLSDIFSDEHQELAKMCALQAAFALDNARLFAAVSNGRERLQNLSHQLVAVQEQERRHIALELHDEIGQVLTGLKFTVQRALNAPPKEVKEVLQLANQQIKEVTAQVREMSLNLRPSMLDDLGLLPAILWHFSRYTDRTNINIDFKHAGLGNVRFNPDVEIAIYRIIQEALTNVARYAHVEDVTVRAIVEDDVLRVDIQDYGTGFDVQKATNSKTSTGLTGMQERIHVLDGEFVIRSTLGMGTHITVRLTLN